MTSSPHSLFSTSYDCENPRSQIIIVHGYADHSGRYDSIAETLAEAGYAVTTFDLRGYGKSDGDPAFITSFDEYVADLETIVKDVHTESSSLPLVLMGHSMGALVVLTSVLNGNIQPDALILSSPALAFYEPAILQKLSGLIARIAPRLLTVELDRTLISRDPVVVGAALNDPLAYHGRTRARTGAEMIRAANAVLAKAEDLILPFLIFHGTGDRLTDHRSSQLLYDRSRSADKTIRLFEGAYHETFNDSCRSEVLAEIVSWLDARFGKS